MNEEVEKPGVYVKGRELIKMKNCKVTDCEHEHYNDFLLNGNPERLPVLPRGGGNKKSFLQ